MLHLTNVGFTYWSYDDSPSWQHEARDQLHYPGYPSTGYVNNTCIPTQYVIVVTHARVPHGIYWLSSDKMQQRKVTSAILCQYLDSGTVQGLTCAIWQILAQCFLWSARSKCNNIRCCNTLLHFEWATLVPLRCCILRETLCQYLPYGTGQALNCSTI